MSFNFGQIAPILSKYMNIDRMDIGRSITITNPNGTTGQTNPEIPLYENVPCHIAYNQTDNANPTTMDTMPIIMSMTIICDEIVDLRNGDLITARKLTHDGEVMETYRGVIGEPYVVQSRKRAQMAMQTYSEEE